MQVSRLRDYACDYDGKTILVTGGAGVIGGDFCRKFSEMSAQKIIILDDLSSSYERNIPKADNIS